MSDFNCTIFLILNFTQFSWNNKFKNLEQLKPASICVAKANTKYVSLYLTALGTVLLSESVTLRTQVDGTLIQIYYKECEMVNESELLAELDCNLYQARVIQYEGQLKRDKTYWSMRVLIQIVSIGYTKRFNFKTELIDAQTWSVKQYEGTVRADKGLLDGARSTFTNCKIRLPINGMQL